MSKFFKWFFPVQLCFFIFLSVNCAGTDPAPAINLTDIVPARHVVFIGLDGWGGIYTNNAKMPTVKRMMAQGASSLHQLSVMPSDSRTNWPAIFSGTHPKEQTENFPSIFSIVNERYEGKTVLFYQWKDLNGMFPDDVVDKQTILSDLESTERIAAYIIERKPVFTAIAYKELDSIGHNIGWGSAQYYAKLTELDGFIAIIEQAVKDAGIFDETVFVLSSDHGGSLWGHGFNFISHRRIPLVFYGKIIKEGFTIPARGSICDIAPTMAAILGLAIPPEWTGQPILGVFQ